MTPRPRRLNWNRRPVLRVLTYVSIVFIIVHTVSSLGLSSRKYDIWPWDVCPGLSPFDSACKASRASISNDVQVVTRTGGTEPRDRLESQLTTVLSKIPQANVVIFSDLEEGFGAYHAYDAFADIALTERDGYPEFSLYNEIQQYKRDGRDTRELKGGWSLSKYLNLALKRKLWEKVLLQDKSERKKWYVFVDSDTFIEWDNLLAFLERFDPEEKWYFGSPVWLPGVPFAHGGSGYVLSYGALKALNEPAWGDGPRYSQYGLNVTERCCGDEGVAVVLKQRGVGLKGYWPMFNGEIPETVGFGDEIWCEPVFSLHHLDVKGMKSLYTWVEDWKRKTIGARPFLFADLFHYIAPQLVPERKDWDNTEEAWKIYLKKTITSFSDCQAACEGDKSCLQFVFHGTKCALSHVIRLGRKREQQQSMDDMYYSGWNLKRINEWAANQPCDVAHWVRHNP